MKLFIKKNYLLILIFLAAFVIRVIGISPGYSPYHPDEPMSSSSALEMIINGNLDPGRYDYPAGVPLVHYFFYRIFFIPIAFLKTYIYQLKNISVALGLGGQGRFELRELIFGRFDINTLFWSRYITAVLGTGTVFLTYFIAKKLFGKKAGLITVFFLAFNYRHVLSSHLALSDIPNNFFALLSVYVSLFLFEKKTLKRYLMVGLSCGLFLSIKYQFFPIFTFLFIQLTWAIRKKTLKEFFNPKFILALFLIPIIFILINPYIFSHFEQVLLDIQKVSRRYGMGTKEFNFYPLFYLYHWGIGQWPSLMIIGGLVLGLIFKPVKALLLGSFIFPFFFVFIYYMSGGTYVRNFTTVIPFLFIFAGFFLSEIFSNAKKLIPKMSFVLTPLIFILVILINLEPIKNSMILSYYYTKPSNYDRFSGWLSKNFPPDVQVRSHSITKIPEDRNIKRIDWHLWQGPISLAELRESGDQFAVMNLDYYHVLFYDWFELSAKKTLEYPGVPYELIAETFPGLVLEELLNYSVKEVFKPWQAYDLNYLVFKIPPSLNKPGKKLVTYDFDETEENWRIFDKFDKEAKGLKWNEMEGNFKKGSLEINQSGTIFSTAHFSSPPIVVVSGKHYTLNGWIKNAIDVDMEMTKEGFLRMDFYNSKADAWNSKNRIGTALSARVTEPSKWIKVEATAIAPEKAEYLIVSFQQTKHSESFSYLDDVTLFESDEIIQENFPNLPYIEATIPKEVLYPNSLL